MRFLQTVGSGMVMALAVALVAVPALADTPDYPDDPVGFPNSLVITEINYNPSPEIEHPLGQWIEVYNPTGIPVSLDGLALEIVDGEGQFVAGGMVEGPDAPVVPPTQFVVLGAAKAFSANGGVPVSYGYDAAIVLPKTGGTIRISYDGTVLDEVSYGPELGLMVEEGRSLNLEPNAKNALANDKPGHWCESDHQVEGGLVLMFGSPAVDGHYCDSDNDGWDEISGDCDDFDPKVSPAAKEKCNGEDDNCNGEFDENLADLPPWPEEGVCTEGGPVCLGLDGWEFIYPEGWQENETICDDMDNDCDGETDEGLRNKCNACGPLPQEVCDGVDNDCDGKVDEGIAPPEDFQCAGGGIGLCSKTTAQCVEGKWQCDPPVGWQAEENLCDDLDNDCDGETDEGFGVGEPCAVGQGMCRSQGSYACGPDKLSLVCQATEDIALMELCGDNIDNDCDGETDEGFAVSDACEVGVGACRIAGKYFCTMDRLGVECSAQPLDPMEEMCSNFIDDDCDGTVDEPDCSEASAELPVGCGTGQDVNSSLTFLLVLTIPLLALMRRRKTGFVSK